MRTAFQKVILLSSVNMKEVFLIVRWGGHSYGSENSGSDAARHTQSTCLTAWMFNVNEIMTTFLVRAVSIY